MPQPTPDDYEVLEIRIRALAAGSYPVEMTLSGEQEFAPGALDATLVQQVRKARWEPRQGEVLFQQLFCDPKLRSAWDRARGAGRSLRLRLRIDAEASELQALPWEAMASVAAGSLGSGAATPFSRYLACEQKHGEPVRERPIRMLAAIACPHQLEEHDLLRFDTESQRGALTGALAEARAEREIELSFLEPPVTPARLAQRLRELRPHVVHLVAHGKKNPAGSALYLEDDERRVELLYEADLAAMLGHLEHPPRLVFLAACESAGDALAGAFRGFAPRLVAAGVPAVLAMQGKVPITTAGEHTAAFYRQLLSHGLVDLAANQARAQLVAAELEGAACPVLFLRLRDGLLFESPAALAKLDLDAYRACSSATLAEKTRRLVPLAVDEVLVVGGRTERVPHADGALPARVVRHPRIVLLGAAGAGKSSALELLARACFEAGSVLAGALPILIELGSVSARAETAAETVVLELVARALWEGRAAADPPAVEAVRSLLETGPALLILIDGLNELSPVLRRGVEAAIEKLAQRYERHRYVLATRPHAFRPLAGWVSCELRPLDDAQVHELLRLAAGGVATEPLVKAVRDARSSQLRLPLFLGFVVELHQDLARLGREIGSRSGILHAYVEKQIQRDLGADSVGAERLRAALACLAATLHDRGRSLQAQEARAVLAERLGLEDATVSQLLDELIRRGFLVDDRGFLSFWHQTLQEYFFAGAFVDGWRESLRTRVSIGALESLRQVLTRAEGEALALATAHLRDEELEPVLRLGLRSNPRLALAWLDDLSMEQRAPLVCQRFLDGVDRFAHRGRLLSGTRSTRLIAAFLTSCSAVLQAGLGLLAALGARWPKMPRLLARTLPWIDALHCPAAAQLEAFFLAIPSLRNESLRARLQWVAAEVGASPVLVGTSVQEAALLARELGALDFEKVIGQIDADPECPSQAAVRVLATVLDPRVLPFLEKMILQRHPLRMRALAVVASRARAFAPEREATETLMAKVVGDDRLDSRVRSGAYGYLMRLGRAPRLGRLLDQAFFADAIQRFGTTLVLFAFVLIFGGWFAPLLAFFARPLSLKKALIIVTALEVVGSLHVGTLSVVASTGHLRSWGEVTPFLVFVAIIAGLVAVDLWRLGARWIPALLGREVAVAPMIAGLTLLLGTLLWVQSGGAATMSPSASGVTGPTYLWLAVLVGVFWLHRRELRPPGATRV